MWVKSSHLRIGSIKIEDRVEQTVTLALTLKCPTCTQVIIIGTRAQPINIRRDQEQEIRTTLLKEAVRIHTCRECGVVSGIPEKDEKELKNKLNAQLTSEWFDRQKKDATIIHQTM